MKSLDALRELQAIAADQWGMLTTAQAAARGVTRLNLSRLTERGQLERLSHGVYRDAAVPGDQFEAVRAAWLSTDPARFAWQRLDEPTAVVSGPTAAWLHGIGTMQPEPFEFATPSRKQARRTDVRFRTRQLDTSDVTLAQGVPTTTIERTVVDLVADHMDHTLIAQCVADAVRAERLDRVLLAGKLDGVTGGKGTELVNELLRLEGLDDESQLRAIIDGPLGSVLTQGFVKALRPHVDFTMSPTVQPALPGFDGLMKIDVSRLWKMAAPTAVHDLSVLVADLVRPKFLEDMGSVWGTALRRAGAIPMNGSAEDDE